MATRKRSAAKRPPAHEVILARLCKLHREIFEFSRSIIAPPTLIPRKHLIEPRRSACGELLTVLSAMHLPEKEEPQILAVLRRLRPEIIGTHRSHVRLLKRLSGHSPTHVAGTKPTRRRA